jgi:ribonuclease HII
VPDFCLESQIGGPACGLDEAGRGPIAGPVVAACVLIAPEARGLPLWAAVDDSKRLPEKRREALAAEIRACALWGLGSASVAEIDALNIFRATFLAMARAVHAMSPPPGAVALVDGNRVPEAFPVSARAVVRGDSVSVSIAAASILAKVARDEIMRALAREHPEYGWERNAGYPTPAHLAALARHGPTPHHRISFAPVKKALATHGGAGYIAGA